MKQRNRLWSGTRSGLMVALVLFLVLGTLSERFPVPTLMAAEEVAAESASAGVDEEQLARLLAPIALYPDTLLVQIFMAATYPLEIVEAARYIKQNPKLTGDKLDKTLEGREWDASIKALCHFPTVLSQMDEHLAATKQLGDLFLADQKAVMEMVQTLRRKAREQGELKSTREQKVEVEGETIIIQPADPKVVYVPAYSTTVVYGSWWYPSPPYVWYPPPPAYGFAAGVAVGVWASSWCHANWRRGEIDIDIDRNININRPGGRQPRGPRARRDRMADGKRQAWKHNPRHRQGVAYRNREVRKRYGQLTRHTRQRDLARGYGGGLDRKTRNQIRKRGLQSNGRFGQGGKRKAQPGAVRGERRARTARQSAGRLQGSARRPASRNRPAHRRYRTRSSRSSSAFSRPGAARSVKRSSMRGRSSRSFGRRGGGRRR